MLRIRRHNGIDNVTGASVSLISTTLYTLSRVSPRNVLTEWRPRAEPEERGSVRGERRRLRGERPKKKTRKTTSSLWEGLNESIARGEESSGRMKL